MRTPMDSIPGVAPTAYPAVYEALVARRAMSQQRLEGEAALRLIEGTAADQGGRPLPPDATVSIRV